MHPIEYHIKLKDPAGHHFEVDLYIEKPFPLGQKISLPTWIPGSYMIRDFSKHIETIEAFSFSNNKIKQSIALKQLDSHTWEVSPTNEPILIRISVYAFDTSVRTAYLDLDRAFYNHSSLCLQAHGFTQSSCLVKIIPNPQLIGWEIATTLNPESTNRFGFGTYRAENYDELIDHPVTIGKMRRIKWKSQGIAHQIVIQGVNTPIDEKRLAQDLSAICDAHIRFFEPKTKRAPFKHYLFIVNTVGLGYGGLEHRSSTALLCKRSDLPIIDPSQKGKLLNQSQYEDFLGLCSHEYFHAWMVKNVQPLAFQPYRLNEKNHTSLLWLFEGFTSYYDDLQLLRSGCISRKSYLERILKTHESVMRTSGRLKQSVTESSFDAWTKYYLMDENTPNAVVSYYAKGSLIALALDLLIRNHTSNKKSLDHVMRTLWKSHGSLKTVPGRGISEHGFEQVVIDAMGHDFKKSWLNFEKKYISGKEDIPLISLLTQQGIQVKAKPLSRTDSVKQRLGLRTTSVDGWVKITHALTGGAAQVAGLSAGDFIVSLNGERITPTNFDKTLGQLFSDEITITAFRHDSQKEFHLSLRSISQTPEYILSE